MVGGILSNVPEYINQDIEELIKEIAKDKVINNRICLARCLLNCKLTQKFSWDQDVFESFIEGQDIYLLKIMLEIYSQDKKKIKIIEENLKKLCPSKK